MTVPVLDTHAWIWWIDQDRRLPRGTVEYLDALPFDERPWVADISLWEVAMLVERGRLAFNIPLRDWLEAAAHRRSVRIVPVSPEIAAEVADLPDTFHRDPADRLIVATCRVLNAPLLTRDARILRARLVTRFRRQG
ncbi:MAG: type II toxin-antitoxin system VapC family toxin [Acidobacteriota bacterium]